MRVVSTDALAVSRMDSCATKGTSEGQRDASPGNDPSAVCTHRVSGEVTTGFQGRRRCSRVYTLYYVNTKMKREDDATRLVGFFRTLRRRTARRAGFK